jgi:hypothetical protein
VIGAVIERSFSWINARFVLTQAQSSALLLSQMESLIDADKLRSYGTESDAMFFSSTAVQLFSRGFTVPAADVNSTRLTLSGLISPTVLLWMTALQASPD